MGDGKTVYLLGFEGTDDNYPYHGRIWSFDTSANGGLGAWNTDPETDEMPDPAYRGMDEYDDAGHYLVRYANGDFGVLYKGVGAADNKNGPLYYRLWNGSWQTAVDLSPGTTAVVGTIIYEPTTELIYLLYSEYWTYTQEQKLLTIGHGGPVSSDLHTFPITGSGASNSPYSPYTGLIHDGTLMFSWIHAELEDELGNPIPGDVTPPIYEWDMSGPVSFTKKFLPLPEGEEEQPYAASLYYGPNGRPVAIHYYDASRIYISERGSDGVWGTPTILYDNTVDAPPFFTAWIFGAGARYSSQGNELGIMCRSKFSPTDADTELYFLRNGGLRINVSDQITMNTTGCPIGNNDHAASGAQWINGAYWYFGSPKISGFNGQAVGPRDIAALRSGDGGLNWTLQDAANAPSVGKWGHLHDTFHEPEDLGPVLEDSMLLTDSIQLRLDGSSLPNVLILDKCPTIKLDSAYCTGFKNLQMGDEDSLACPPKFWEISSEPCP
jgi:hypothetical protein